MELHNNEDEEKWYLMLIQNNWYLILKLGFIMELIMVPDFRKYNFNVLKCNCSIISNQYE